MAGNSSVRGKQSRHHHKPRRPSVQLATVTPAAPCEVAFPGNRIFSPSPTDELPDHSVDVHHSDVNDGGLIQEPSSDEGFLSRDDHVSSNVSTQLATNSNDADTSIADTSQAVASDNVISLTVTPTESSNHSEILAKANNIENAVSRGIYMENGSTEALPLEPLKAEKLATFGESSRFDNLMF